MRGKVYNIARLIKDWIGKNKAIYRLIDKAFVTSIKNLTVLNNIDGNKVNNNIENIEWYTEKQLSKTFGTIRCVVTVVWFESTRKHLGLL